MTGKAKPKKHTAKEINNKIKAATANMGGGKSGLEDRKGGKAGHAKLICYICMQNAPDLKSMKLHHESKHSKITFDESKYENVHEKYGGTTKGIAVKGSTKK